MKNLLIVFSSLILLVSCEKKLEKPQNFIEKDKFEQILYDISLFYSIKGLNSYGNDSVKRVDMNSILRKHGIDSLTFSQNNRYYIELHKGVYREIQSKVLERLDAQKVLVDSLYERGIDNQMQLDAAPALDTISSGIEVNQLEDGAIHELERN